MSFSDFLAIPAIIFALGGAGFLNQSLAYQRAGLSDPEHNWLKGLVCGAIAFGIGYWASQMG